MLLTNVHIHTPAYILQLQVCFVFVPLSWSCRKKRVGEVDDTIGTKRPDTPSGMGTSFLFWSRSQSLRVDSNYCERPDVLLCAKAR